MFTNNQVYCFSSQTGTKKPVKIYVTPELLLSVREVLETPAERVQALQARLNPADYQALQAKKRKFSLGEYLFSATSRSLLRQIWATQSSETKWESVSQDGTARIIYELIQDVPTDETVYGLKPDYTPMSSVKDEKQDEVTPGLKKKGSADGTESLLGSVAKSIKRKLFLDTPSQKPQKSQGLPPSDEMKSHDGGVGGDVAALLRVNAQVAKPFFDRSDLVKTLCDAFLSLEFQKQVVNVTSASSEALQKPQAQNQPALVKSFLSCTGKACPNDPDAFFSLTESCWKEFRMYLKEADVSNFLYLYHVARASGYASVMSVVPIMHEKVGGENRTFFTGEAARVVFNAAVESGFPVAQGSSESPGIKNIIDESITLLKRWVEGLKSVTGELTPEQAALYNTARSLFLAAETALNTLVVGSFEPYLSGELRAQYQALRLCFVAEDEDESHPAIEWHNHLVAAAVELGRLPSDPHACKNKLTEIGKLLDKVPVEGLSLVAVDIGKRQKLEQDYRNALTHTDVVLLLKELESVSDSSILETLQKKLETIRTAREAVSGFNFAQNLALSCVAEWHQAQQWVAFKSKILLADATITNLETLRTFLESAKWSEVLPIASMEVGQACTALFQHVIKLSALIEALKVLPQDFTQVQGFLGTTAVQTHGQVIHQLKALQGALVLQTEQKHSDTGDILQKVLKENTTLRDQVEQAQTWLTETEPTALRRFHLLEVTEAKDDEKANAYANIAQECGALERQIQGFVKAGVPEGWFKESGALIQALKGRCLEASGTEVVRVDGQSVFRKRGSIVPLSTPEQVLGTPRIIRAVSNPQAPMQMTPPPVASMGFTTPPFTPQRKMTQPTEPLSRSKGSSTSLTGVSNQNTVAVTWVLSYIPSYGEDAQILQSLRGELKGHVNNRVALQPLNAAVEGSALSVLYRAVPKKSLMFDMSTSKEEKACLDALKVAGCAALCAFWKELGCPQSTVLTCIEAPADEVAFRDVPRGIMQKAELAEKREKVKNIIAVMEKETGNPVELQQDLEQQLQLYPQALQGPQHQLSCYKAYCKEGTAKIQGALAALDASSGDAFTLEEAGIKSFQRQYQALSELKDQYLGVGCFVKRDLPGSLLDQVIAAQRAALTRYVKDLSPHITSTSFIATADFKALETMRVEHLDFIRAHLEGLPDDGPRKAIDALMRGIALKVAVLQSVTPSVWSLQSLQTYLGKLKQEIENGLACPEYTDEAQRVSKANAALEKLRSTQALLKCFPLETVYGLSLTTTDSHQWCKKIQALQTQCSQAQKALTALIAFDKLWNTQVRASLYERALYAPKAVEGEAKKLWGSFVEMPLEKAQVWFRGFAAFYTAYVDKEAVESAMHGYSSSHATRAQEPGQVKVEHAVFKFLQPSKVSPSPKSDAQDDRISETDSDALPSPVGGAQAESKASGEVSSAGRARVLSETYPAAFEKVASEFITLVYQQSLHYKDIYLRDNTNFLSVGAATLGASKGLQASISKQMPGEKAEIIDHYQFAVLAVAACMTIERDSGKIKRWLQGKPNQERPVVPLKMLVTNFIGHELTTAAALEKDLERRVLEEAIVADLNKALPSVQGRDVAFVQQAAASIHRVLQQHQKNIELLHESGVTGDFERVSAVLLRAQTALAMLQAREQVLVSIGQLTELQAPPIESKDSDRLNNSSKTPEQIVLQAQLLTTLGSDFCQSEVVGLGLVFELKKRRETFYEEAKELLLWTLANVRSTAWMGDLAKILPEDMQAQLKLRLDALPEIQLKVDVAVATELLQASTPFTEALACWGLHKPELSERINLSKAVTSQDRLMQLEGTLQTLQDQNRQLAQALWNLKSEKEPEQRLVARTSSTTVLPSMGESKEEAERVQSRAMPVAPATVGEKCAAILSAVVLQQSLGSPIQEANLQSLVGVQTQVALTGEAERFAQEQERQDIVSAVAQVFAGPNARSIFLPAQVLQIGIGSAVANEFDRLKRECVQGRSSYQDTVALLKYCAGEHSQVVAQLQLLLQQRGVVLTVQPDKSLVLRCSVSEADRLEKSRYYTEAVVAQEKCQVYREVLKRFFVLGVQPASLSQLGGAVAKFAPNQSRLKGYVQNNSLWSAENAVVQVNLLACLEGRSQSPVAEQLGFLQGYFQYLAASTNSGRTTQLQAAACVVTGLPKTASLPDFVARIDVCAISMSCLFGVKKERSLGEGEEAVKALNQLVNQYRSQNRSIVIPSLTQLENALQKASQGMLQIPHFATIFGARTDVQNAVGEVQRLVACCAQESLVQLGKARIPEWKQQLAPIEKLLAQAGDVAGLQAGYERYQAAVKTLVGSNVATLDVPTFCKAQEKLELQLKELTRQFVQVALPRVITVCEEYQQDISVWPTEMSTEIREERNQKLQEMQLLMLHLGASNLAEEEQEKLLEQLIRLQGSYQRIRDQCVSEKAAVAEQARLKRELAAAQAELSELKNQAKRTQKVFSQIQPQRNAAAPVSSSQNTSATAPVGNNSNNQNINILHSRGLTTTTRSSSVGVVGTGDGSGDMGGERKGDDVELQSPVSSNSLALTNVPASTASNVRGSAASPAGAGRNANTLGSLFGRLRKKREEDLNLGLEN